MTGVRLIGLPAVAGVSSFHETNVRTYVRLGNRDPGVWFFNLEAASAIAVRVARRLFHLPYHYARMFLEHESIDPTTHQPPFFTPERGAGRLPYPPRTPSAQYPMGPSGRPRQAPSNTFSWTLCPFHRMEESITPGPSSPYTLSLTVGKTSRVRRDAASRCWH